MAAFKIGDIVKIKTTNIKGIVVETWTDSNYKPFLGVEHFENVLFHTSKRKAVPLPADLFELVKDEPKTQEEKDNAVNTENN